MRGRSASSSAVAHTQRTAASMRPRRTHYVRSADPLEINHCIPLSITALSSRVGYAFPKAGGHPHSRTVTCGAGRQPECGDGRCRSPLAHNRRGSCPDTRRIRLPRLPISSMAMVPGRFGDDGLTLAVQN